jgi:hypothetical protein
LATAGRQITVRQQEGNILAILLERFKALRKPAERRLLIFGAMAALSCGHLTPVFAQVPAESWATSTDDTDAASIGGTTQGQTADGVGDQVPKADAAGQSSSGSTPSQPSTSGASNQSSAESEPQSLHVNPVTGLVSTSPANYEPLTGSERLNLYFKMNYASVGAYFGPFFTALVLDQTTNSPAQWGGGFKGYGRRVASRMGDAILQGTFQAPAAAVLHEDVRYIVSSQHGFKSRAWHAIKYSFLTYNDQGRSTLNVANLGAYYASTAVSTAWLPGRRNIASYTLSNATEQIGLSLPVNLLQEFWPEVRHFVLRRH